LNWNKWVRQTHRWLSVAFTAAVIVNFVAVLLGKYTRRVGLLAVIPLSCRCSRVSVLVRAAVCYKVAQRATHRLNGGRHVGRCCRRG
jgi:purine-cytosine permease-like protein